MDGAFPEHPVSMSKTPANDLFDIEKVAGHTLVPDHPNLKASSLATSSPKPNINPFTNGKKRLIAAPLNRPQNVGGEYSISGELEDEGGDGDSSWLPS